MEPVHMYSSYFSSPTAINVTPINHIDVTTRWQLDEMYACGLRPLLPPIGSCLTDNMLCFTSHPTKRIVFCSTLGSGYVCSRCPYLPTTGPFAASKCSCSSAPVYDTGGQA
eukprot:3724506-Amphidinium_carterae.1